MKVVVLAVVAAIAACKPDPSAKPAEGSAVPAAQQPRARAPGPRPTLPGEQQAGSAEVSAPVETKHRWADKDGDGIVTPQERATAREERMKRMHDRFDTNHDGKLTPDELSGTGSGNGSDRHGPHFENATALDTNHDGEISADELEQGLRELRAQRRHQRADGSAQ